MSPVNIDIDFPMLPVASWKGIYGIQSYEDTQINWLKASQLVLDFCVGFVNDYVSYLSKLSNS